MSGASVNTQTLRGHSPVLVRSATQNMANVRLRTPDKTCSELARGKEISLVGEVLFAAQNMSIAGPDESNLLAWLSD